ncbi:hypothetical protein E2C01_008757 [Portunus trituberculatus]|uniref:Uncharacterized protein n=1 Tax=Portunus trituberculatus TaxID=210409 RepID=A0A5B7D5L2_PORTR|nr:hypothetical protein [Portunus trituberculatus]
MRPQHEQCKETITKRAAVCQTARLVLPPAQIHPRQDSHMTHTSCLTSCDTLVCWFMRSSRRNSMSQSPPVHLPPPTPPGRSHSTHGDSYHSLHSS